MRHVEPIQAETAVRSQLLSASSNTDASKTPAISKETQISSQETEFEQESTYYHAAIYGAVVTEQDSSPFLLM